MDGDSEQARAKQGRMRCDGKPMLNERIQKAVTDCSELPEQCIRRLATRLCHLDSCEGYGKPSVDLSAETHAMAVDHGHDHSHDHDRNHDHNHNHGHGHSHDHSHNHDKLHCSSTASRDTPCQKSEEGFFDVNVEQLACCSGSTEGDICCGVEDKEPHSHGGIAAKSTECSSSTVMGQSHGCHDDSRKPLNCCHVEAPIETGCCTADVGKVAACCSAFHSTESSSSPSLEDSCSDSCCDSKQHLSDKFDSSDCSSSECSSQHSDAGHMPQVACSSHLQAAFQRYEALLAKGQCLCRSVLEQFGTCCCKPGLNHGPSSRSRTSAKAYSAAHGGHIIDKAGCGGSQHAHGTCCGDDSKGQATFSPVGHSRQVDVEKGAGLEHIVLSISGMDCTGCGRKVMNVLCNIRGAFNPKVTFVSGTAEFDLDTSMAEIDTTLSQIEKQTGFKCSRITSGYPHLDLIMPETVARQLEETDDEAIIAVSRRGKKTYRVTYNPRLMGARAFLSPQVQLAPSKGDIGAADGKKRLWAMLWSFVLSAVFTIPVVVLNWSDNPISQTTRSSVSLALATVVQAIAVPEFYIAALKALIFSRMVEMDMLVVISITAAYLYSVVAFALTQQGIKLEQGPFFETSALLITLVLLGRLLAAYARVRAVSAVSTRSLQAETALLARQGGEIEKLDARLLQFGDTIKILPHSRFVTDGRIVEGESTVDESMVTGESTPVRKGRGDMAIAGTINGSGTLSLALSRLPGENSITDIANLVDNAMGSKPRIQNLADRIASWFVPVVMFIAVAVFAIWIGIALKVQHHTSGGAVGIAITYAIAVLAITCPCALGLAVPMVLVIAGGVAARFGVIIRSAEAVERSFKVTDVIFDKTGTLTTGELEVVDERRVSESICEDEVVALVKALVEGNEHPVSLAVAQHVKARCKTKAGLEKIQSIPSAGVQAVWNGRKIKAGNPHWLHLEHDATVMELLQKGVSMFCVTVDGELLRAFAIKGRLRDEAATVIAKLQARRINCHLVSGDNTAAVSAIAHTLGLDPKHVVSHSTPAEKQKYVQHLQSQGSIALFCGDGTNDAVAVAQADIGVQMGSASDVTGAVADVVLLGGLEGIVRLLDISRKAFRRIVFNFVWTWVYNTFAILLAAGAFVHFRVPPAYAGLGEIVSVGPVIIVAVTLVWMR